MDQAKLLDRLRKLQAVAARQVGNDGTANAHEAALAADRLFEALAKPDRPLPLRYIVEKGSPVRLVPTHTRHQVTTAEVVRTTATRNNVFAETMRLRDEDGIQALRLGYFGFERFGYLVFVKLTYVKIYF